MEANRKVVYVSRTESFAAAHRLHSNSLSDAENKAIFDKCNNANGHGHNYKVSVTVRGYVNTKTGMTIDVAMLKRTLKEVIDVLDHKHLDKDVAYFSNTVSTTENLSVYIWERMTEILPASNDYKLYEVKIDETDNNTFTYRGEME